MAAFPGYCGIFASCNYLAESCATPLCLTQTIEGTFLFLRPFPDSALLFEATGCVLQGVSLPPLFLTTMSEVGSL